MEVKGSITEQELASLTSAAALDPLLVGSKAANLASLRQSGFPVPEGVVITAATRKDMTEIAAERVLARLGDRPLAVRSSATAEDLPDASYAGQYESYLGVKGLEELKTAITACRDSVHSKRVSTYSGGSGDTAMAVLIQPMIDADSAGVAFSAHPVSGARNQVVVNAVEGLGDRLVSGEVNPDQWVVEEKSIDRATGVLDRSQILRIAELTRRVEDHFGSPQDIEWAIHGDSLWLLQARPITSLPEPPTEPIPIDFEIPPGYWEHDASHSPTASYSIDSFIPSLVEEAIDSWAIEFGYLFDGIEFRDIGGWLYNRLVPLGGREGPELPGWLMWVLVRTVPMIRKRLAMAREAVRTDKAGQFIDRWYDTWLPELAAFIEEIKAVDLSALTDRDLVAHISDVRRLCTRGVEIHILLHGALAIILYEMVTTCERLLGWDMATTLETVRGTSYKSTEPGRRLNELADLARKQPEVLAATQLPDDRIVAWLRATNEAFAIEFEQYIADYGHLALGQSVAEPTYAEVPSVLMGTIKHQVDTGFEPGSVDNANRERREEAIKGARTHLANAPGSLDEFDIALDRAHKAYPVREDNEFYTLSAPLAQFRYAILEIGDRLARRDMISSRDEVMFLELEEALGALSERSDLKDLVDRRKGERAWAIANPGPPFYGEETPPPTSLSFLPEDTRLPMEAMLWSLESIMAVEASKTAQTDSDRIQGTPVSAGSYTGPVRVVMNESEFSKIEAGDVLVCPITSPVWSVVFPSIGALITNTGGILSHPAIIAREYRIPAVVATGNATELLRDGQVVTVDGTAGTVVKVVADTGS